MFDHPLVKSRVLAIGYIAVWPFILIMNVSLSYFYGTSSLGDILIENGIPCLVFAIMSIPLWYSVNSCSIQRGEILFLFHHLGTAAITIMVWHYISYSLIALFAPSCHTATMPVEQLVPLVIFHGFLGYTIVVLSYYLYIYSQNLREKHEKELLLQRSLKEVEISMLRAQINPHFLFNSLNSISSLTMVDADRAQEMVVKLSDYLRYTVSQEKTPFVALSKEIENIHRYLDIEKIRFGAKLQYSFAVEDEAADAAMPAMILQPLFENAIKHGVYESTEPIMVETKAYMEDDVLIVSIRNNYQEGAPMGKGAGIGLRNIAERLKLIYQNETLLHIKNENQVFEVTLIIPSAKKSVA
ncbi:histidine kinase [uncultured Acetobacteroides sp.]|uniref:sensor histidine kinase n=1 Tax=uncultured Acetobacteroides sp. TaxID=1760811 RepID=UPI0029F477DC|nr:histidine kinase [uncultured Acetobacteroides sp.]